MTQSKSPARRKSAATSASFIPTPIALTEPCFRRSSSARYAPSGCERARKILPLRPAINVMNEKYVDLLEAKTYHRLLDRAHDAVVAVVENRKQLERPRPIHL